VSVEIVVVNSPTVIAGMSGRPDSSQSERPSSVPMSAETNSIPAAARKPFDAAHVAQLRCQ
jgi:hypothetical protein